MSKPSLPVMAAMTLRAGSKPTPETSPGTQSFFPPLRRADAVAIWAVLLFACALYVTGAGFGRLFDQIDGQYAGAAREMLARGDLLVPTQDGVPRLQKPPLLYWLEIASFHTFGVNEFAARVPIVLSTLGWFAITGRFAWRLTGRATLGALAALVLATFSGTFFFTHLVMPEPFLAFTMALTFLAFWSAQEPMASSRQRAAWLLAAWFFIACGSLAKGLHALIFPALAYGLVALVSPDFRRPFRRFITFWPGWLLFLSLLLPWYFTIETRYPGFLQDHFWNEQVGHVFNRRWPPDAERLPLALFWVEHLGLLFPWTGFLPLFALQLTAARRRWRAQVGDPANLLWAWFIVNAVTISFSSIQDYYLVVSWPTLAIAIAAAFSSWPHPAQRRAAILSGMVLVASGAAALVVSGFLDGRLRAGPTITGKPEYHILAAFAAVPVAGLFSQLLQVAAVFLVLGGSAVALCAYRNRPALAAAFTGAISLVILGEGAIGLGQTEDLFSSARIADYLKHTANGDDEVVSESEANDYTSFFFYLPHRLRWVNAHPETEFATRVLGVGRNLFMTEEQVVRAWNGNRPVFLIIQKHRLAFWREHLAGLESGVRIGLDCGQRLVLTNRSDGRSLPDTPPGNVRRD